MIPYFSFTGIDLGPITLHTWGFFQAVGLLVGGLVAHHFAKRQGLKAEVIFDLLVWLVLAGMVGGRLGHVFFYDFDYFAADPMRVFFMWNGGMSIMGSFALAVPVLIWQLRKRQLDVWHYADAMAFGLPFGYWIGRVGCFLIHDHPGTATDFVLGVQYPDGVTRHDHGLYLSITGFVIAVLFFFMARKERPVGTYLVTFFGLYGLVRLYLDQFRVEDAQYVGLTPGQYFGIGFILIAFYLARKIRNNDRWLAIREGWLKMKGSVPEHRDATLKNPAE